MRLAGTRMKHHPSRAGLTQESKAGPVWTGEVRLNETALLDPLKWKRPRRIFWNAHGDLFHDAVPDDWIDRVLAVCALTPHHTHMILTKRSARMRAYFAHDEGFGRWGYIEGRAKQMALHAGGKALLKSLTGKTLAHFGGGSLPNVWLGVSVEDQTRADERIPDLLDTPAAIRFISAEPLLGPVNLSEVPWHVAGYSMEGTLPDSTESDDFRFWHHEAQGIRWVIVGGESGPGARPMHPDWARSLRDQCAAAGVAFHFKQWGSCLPGDMEGEDERGNAAYNIDDVAQPIDYDMLGRGRLIEAHGREFIQFHHHRCGRLLDGIEHNGFPA
jgi:protein gp37